MRLMLVLTLFCAALLTLMPMPAGLAAVRPLWLPMTVVAWAWVMPEVVGLGWAWFVGLWLDVLSNGRLGVHALVLLLLVWLMQMELWRQRWQTRWAWVSLIMACALVCQCLLYGVEWALGQPLPTTLFWPVVLSSGFLWPLTVGLLTHICWRKRKPG